MPPHLYVVAVALKRRSGKLRLLVRRRSGSSNAHLRAALGSSLHLRRNLVVSESGDPNIVPSIVGSLL